MRTRLLSLSAIVLPAAFACAQQEPAAVPAVAEARRPFVRFVEAPDGGKVEALIATYRRDQTTVILFAALHMADAEFYAALEKRFARCDALLYELVADPDVRPYPGMDRSMYDEDLVTLVQMAMGRGFSLQFQDEGIDYRADNFVHADMTYEEFDAAMEEAGTSLVGEVFRGGLPEVDREAEAKQRRLDLVKAFRSGRGAHEMCLLGARLITEPDPTNAEPTVMIEGRNDKCLAVLEQQLVLGKQQLGIFYGAAHMEHMERRLLDGLGFRHVGDEWVTAWDCSASRFPTAEKGLKRKRYRARRDLEKLQETVASWCGSNPGETPTWERVRTAQGGKLPGRADGVDPWGSEYGLHKVRGRYHVFCQGSDGKPGTDDDVVLEQAAKLWNPFAGASKNAESVTAKHRADAYARAVRYYHVRNGRLPESLAQLVEEGDGMRYLRKLERDPWGNAFVLRGDTIADFEIISLGRDGVADTEDDISSKAPRPERKGPFAGVIGVQREAKLLIAEVRVVTTADSVALFFLTNGRLPDSLEELAEVDESGRVYIEDLAPDPWGNGYVLRGATKDDFAVVSLGPDGKEGTADDISSRDGEETPEQDTVGTPKENAKTQRVDAARQAKLATAKASIKTLTDAVEMFYVRKGRLPGSLTVLTRPENGGPFLQRLEPDPWGNVYLLVGKTKADFAVISFGPDGIGSSADDLSSRQKPESPAKKGTGAKR